MKERRQYERFQLSVPARVRSINPEEKHVFDLQTMNISAGGAFLHTTESFSKGKRFRLELTVPSKRIAKLTGTQSLIKVEGSVVRTTPTGVAINFNGDCQIMSLKGM
jgi:hypothetical protein